jgi:hypothetical protein
VWAVAGCAARTDGGAWATASCDIHSLADPDLDAAADLDLGPTADLDIDATADCGVDAAANIDPAAADSTGYCCGGLGRQAGVAVTRSGRQRSGRLLAGPSVPYLAASR